MLGIIAIVTAMLIIPVIITLMGENQYQDQDTHIYIYMREQPLGSI